MVLCLELQIASRDLCLIVELHAPCLIIQLLITLEFVFPD